MPDLGPRWVLAEREPLGLGGQGQAYLVSEVQNPNGERHVAKILN